MLGKGFLLAPEQARDLIQRDPRNKDVLFPYLNGEDLNSRPDCSASRWVINFHDWSEERARSYPEVFAIVERDVKPERLKNNNRQRREIWWRFTRPAMDLYRAISDLDRVLVVALVSRTAMPVAVPTGQVFSHMLGVFASADAGQTSLLCSGIHFSWTVAQASTLENRIRYTPSDVYDTMPQPRTTERMRTVGHALETRRIEAMTERRLGLTRLYNLIHDPAVKDTDIVDLRRIHQEIDEAVGEAYGWNDLDLVHDFHETRQGCRLTFRLSSQTEVLDRLLELNHEQHASSSGHIRGGRGGASEGRLGPKKEKVQDAALF